MDNVDRVKPVTPDEIHEQMLRDLPNGVIATWNTLIARHWNDKEARIYQEDAVKALQDAGYKRTEIFGRCYLDIEPIYRAAGWNVHYDKPGYNESYDANFTFTRKKK